MYLQHGDGNYVRQNNVAVVLCTAQLTAR